MGRACFEELRNLKHAYIRNPSGKRSPTKRRKKITHFGSDGVSFTTERGPNGVRKVITIPGEVTAVRSGPKRKKRPTSAKRADQGANGNSPPSNTEDGANAAPSHWRRRTKKKDWFG
jgi:hypothetical protein